MEEIFILVKRIIATIFMPAVLVCLLFLTATTVNAERILITDPAAVSGKDFTDSAAMAQKLDAIFEGNAGIYRDLACTNPVDTTLGTSPVKNNGIYMFVEPVDGKATNIGTSCWIYANGVYYTLFGEATGNGIGENSEKLNLSATDSRTLNYQNFKAWGVRQGVGALVRASGHSMIVLGYDEDTLTVIDGNGNGNGLVAVRTQPWEYYGSYVEYIIQPKDAHYADLYACGMCGEDAQWVLSENGTLTISGSGEILYPAWRNLKEQVQRIVIAGSQLQIRDSIFAGCSNLQEIQFTGGVPVFSEIAFTGVSATVKYPASQPGWADATRKNYGGQITWEMYGMIQANITRQPVMSHDNISCTSAVTIDAEGDGLIYHWYVKDLGADTFVKASVNGSVYRAKCSNQTQYREVLCIVEDRYGNLAMSETVSLQ